MAKAQVDQSVMKINRHQSDVIHLNTIVNGIHILLGVIIQVTLVIVDVVEAYN